MLSAPRFLRLRAAIRRRLGVRWRAVAAAVAVVAVALLFGGLLLVTVLRHSLTGNAQNTTAQRAADVAAQISADDVQASLPTLNASLNDSTLVQILTADGTVMAASPGIEGENALTDLLPADGQTVNTQFTPSSGDGEPYAVSAVGIDTQQGPVIVVAAQSLESAQASVATVSALLLVGAPLLLIAVGLGTWIAVGRSLGAMNRIRERVDLIGATDLHQRVPIPEAQDEVADLATTMNSMLERLDQAAAAQRRFVADASHELRSPLASLKVSMDVAEIADTPEEWQLAAPVIRDELTRMTQLVDDLLFLARADDGTSPMRSFDVDIDDIVGREAIRLRSQTGLHIQTDLLAARTRGDPARLAQVIRNLADNASRFAASTIRFGVNVDAGVVRISIEDDGPGVPADQRDRVLERFVRLDDARSRWDGGTGLGLAIAVEIVKAHGGSLRIDDSTLGGARVRVLLPIRVTEKSAAVRSQPITNATDRLKRAPVEGDVNLAP